MSFWLIDLLAGAAWWVEDWQTWLFVPALWGFFSPRVPPFLRQARLSAARRAHSTLL